MAKKNPNIFTIGFKKHDPRHQRAVEILNTSEEKAELIATALLYYHDGRGNYESEDMRQESLLPLIKNMVQEEIQKSLMGKEYTPLQSEAGKPESGAKDRDREPAEEPDLEWDDSLRQNIAAALDVFRQK